jgi:hypothetical protein
VFVWVGQNVDPKEKQNAFEIAQVRMLNRSKLLFSIFHFARFQDLLYVTI